MQYDMELSFLPCTWKEFWKLWDVSYDKNITQNEAILSGSAYLNKKYHENCLPCIALVIRNLSCLQLLLSNKILHFIPVFGSRRSSLEKKKKKKEVYDWHFGITCSRCRTAALIVWCLGCLVFRETVLKEELEDVWECT